MGSVLELAEHLVMVGFHEGDGDGRVGTLKPMRGRIPEYPY